jgi:two-component sensor histidine kinase
VLTLGMLISELITNSVKYAHPTGVPVQIEISCRQNGGRLTIEIADDGIGLPENFDPTKDGGLGLRIVRSLAVQLGASVRFDSNELGTSVQLAMAAPLSRQ